MSSGGNESGKVAFSLGGNKKKKKKNLGSKEAKETAASFARDSKRTTSLGGEENPNGDSSRSQDPLVIPLSQPTQSLLTRIKQEGSNENNEDKISNSNKGVKREEYNEEKNAASNSSTSFAAVAKEEPDPPPESMPSSGTTNGMTIVQSASSSAGRAPPGEPVDNSKDQLQRDLEALPDETNEESYEQVPVSQFGAALLRGMGWNEQQDSTKNKGNDQGMPRPHRLGLGAIPKAPNPDDYMPSVLSGNKNKNKKKKLTVQQLQQQEEYERKQKLLQQQDKQRTKQIGSIVHLNNNNNHRDDYDNNSRRRAKIVQLQGVPGLNMVLVQMESTKEDDYEQSPTAIKKGEIGSLVERWELEEHPFVLGRKRVSSNERRKGDDKNHYGRDNNNSHKDDRDRDKGSRRRRDYSRSRSRSPDGNYDDDENRRRGRSRGERRRRSRSRSPEERRKRDRDRRDRTRGRSRSRSPDDDVRNRDRKRGSRDYDRRDRKRDRSRSEERDYNSSDNDERRRRKSSRSDRKRGRRDTDGKSDDRSRSERKYGESSYDNRDRIKDERNRKRRRNDDDDYSVDDYNGGRQRRHEGRKEEKSSSSRGSSKRSKKHEDDDSNNNPLWIIPNIRVRVVTEKLGKKYFKQKGVIVDVTRRHGATLRMDMTNGTSSVVLEHVPERYLETALPKAGGNAIVLTGSNKWTKGRLLERNSKTSKGSIQVFEDMSILTLSLDDLAEWVGPLDGDLG